MRAKNAALRQQKAANKKHSRLAKYLCWNFNEILNRNEWNNSREYRIKCIVAAGVLCPNLDEANYRECSLFSFASRNKISPLFVFVAGWGTERERVKISRLIFIKNPPFDFILDPIVCFLSATCNAAGHWISHCEPLRFVLKKLTRFSVMFTLLPLAWEITHYVF